MVGERKIAMPTFVPRMARAIRRKFSRTNGTRMKKIAASGAPSIRNGLRRPKRERVRSDRLPIHGWTNMLMMLSQVRMNPMTRAESPRSSSMGGIRLLNSGQMMLMPKKPKPSRKVRPQGKRGVMLHLISKGGPIVGAGGARGNCSHSLGEAAPVQVAVDGGEDLEYHILMLRIGHAPGTPPGVALPIGTDTREVRACVILAGSSAVLSTRIQEENLCHAER
jgi:hypothetical protein